MLVEQGVRVIARGAALVDAQRIDRLTGHRLDRPAMQFGDATAREHPWQGSCSMARLFITGLAGLLGGELATRAVAAGWDVAGGVFERPGPPGIEAVRLDVRDSRRCAGGRRSRRRRAHGLPAGLGVRDRRRRGGVARCAPARLIILPRT